MKKVSKPYEMVLMSPALEITSLSMLRIPSKLAPLERARVAAAWDTKEKVGMKTSKIHNPNDGEKFRGKQISLN